MSNNKIIVKGAKMHNLKNIDVEIPRDKMVVLTGLSGSGKSSLAFDTIYAEGQRRYVESLSSYARQFLGQMEKPDVEMIEGLSPAISIDQKTTSKNPRSTVGTVTEIYDYLRLLYARIGIPHCPICGKEIKKQTVDEIVDRIMSLPEGKRIQILSPIVRGRKGEYVKELERTRKNGFVRVRIDGIIYDLSEEISLDKNKKHTIEIIVDRLVIGNEIRARLADSVETATGISGGLVSVDVIDDEELTFSQNFSCPDHNIQMNELEPRMFSFNNPFGACASCSGLGITMHVSPEKVIKDPSKSLREGAINTAGWSFLEGSSISAMYFRAVADYCGFSLDTPVCDLPKEAIDVILYGTKGVPIKMVRESFHKSGISTYEAPFEGIVNNLERRFHETKSSWMRDEIESYMDESPCPDCRGQRLKAEVLAVTIGNKNISEFCELSVVEALDFIDNLPLTSQEHKIADGIIKEIISRLNFLKNVGLEYLNLSRSAGSLSGGEAQRIRLATQIGTSLMGVLYILDEPSIGLHQRDNDKLITTLKKLRDLGNTLIVVEHDEDTMKSSDWIVDIGPGAGVHGGNVVFSGTPDSILHCKESITGQFLSGKRKIAIPKKRREGNGHYLTVIGAEENNLQSIDVSFKLGVFNCVTGVSGSGKSSLVNEILYKSLAKNLNRALTHPGKHLRVDGLEYLDKVINIDQSPIGRTPRSNPATYTGAFNDIRSLFAMTPEAKKRGYNAGRFSFNVRGGRCEACQGDGVNKIEMHFLPDIYVPCEVCNGKRYNRETLEVTYKGKNIYDILEMTVEEGTEFFAEIPKIKKRLQMIVDVGLGYIKIGQPATTLSGGEAQRVKLATELSKHATGKTVYILDEPTTGLHSADVEQLLKVLQRLVDSGNTVIVIEHNLDVIKSADYIVDLGPDGGDKGGQIVAVGTPEEVAQNEKSYTGQYLKKCLKKG